jgi:hypothetical protein
MGCCVVWQMGTNTVEEPAAFMFRRKMKSAGSSKMLVFIYQIAWCYIPEDCEILTSVTIYQTKIP